MLASASSGTIRQEVECMTPNGGYGYDGTGPQVPLGDTGPAGPGQQPRRSILPWLVAAALLVAVVVLVALGRVHHSGAATSPINNSSQLVSTPAAPDSGNAVPSSFTPSSAPAPANSAVQASPKASNKETGGEGGGESGEND
jgi:hypothetical protein